MDFNPITVVFLSLITFILFIIIFKRSPKNNYINGSVRPIILNPDFPIEESVKEYSIPYIRDELYLKLINDSRGLYLSIEDDKFVLSPNKHGVILSSI